MGFERHHSALLVASLVTVTSFVGATAFTQNRLARLDALSSAIENNAVPSIEHLSRAAVRLTRINQLLDNAAAGGSQRAIALGTARTEVLALEDDLAGYLRLEPLEGEQEFWAALRGDVARAVQLIHSSIDVEYGDGAPPDAARVDDAIDHAVRSLLDTLDFDVRKSEEMARAVRNLRVATLRLIVELDAAATVVALVAVLVAYHASRRHDQLLHAHSALLSDRVAELDQFAGRVAHDVLSPLGAIATGLALIARSADEDSKSYVERSQRALRRVQELVEGLLTFARSGARPDPSSRCSLDRVLASVIADSSQAAAEHGVDLVVDTPGTDDVACTVGVLTSIVQNLVRNAISYMTGPVRRIIVRARPIGQSVRLEVEDTGPGIAPELQGRIFDPFVRGEHSESTGTGLGLSTVKRLVESHGGSLGVRSAPGAGSLFWVELPVAVITAAGLSDAKHTV